MTRSKAEQRERKRVATLKKNHTDEERRAWSSRAGKASPTKFTSEKAREANRIRWERVRANKQQKEGA